MTPKKRMSKLYRSLGDFSEKYVMPAVLAIFGLGIMYFLSNRVFIFALEKTSSKGWAWIITIVFLIVFVSLGSANDKAKADTEETKKRKTQKDVTRRIHEPVVIPPSSYAENAEYQVVRVPQF